MNSESCLLEGKFQDHRSTWPLIQLVMPANVKSQVNLLLVLISLIVFQYSYKDMFECIENLNIPTISDLFVKLIIFKLKLKS